MAISSKSAAELLHKNGNTPTYKQANNKQAFNPLMEWLKIRFQSLSLHLHYN